MSTISWVVLTCNRADKVERSLTHNIKNAGCKYDELVWVDNGSTDNVHSFMRGLNPDVAILNKRNLGVGPGYNRGMALATCDYIVITGCDMLMPENWLKTFKEYVDVVTNTGVACIYSRDISCHVERQRTRNGRQQETINGFEIIHAMPLERRIFSRELLKKIGYLREDFGLYGYEDIEWAYRAERVCDELGKCGEHGLLYYVIPNMIAEHLGTEGVEKFDGKDDEAYHAFKAKEANDPHKQEVMAWARKNNFPYFNPYA